MSRGIQPEILAMFEEIIPEHGDLDEYLQALVAQERSSFAQHPSSDTLEDEADGDLDEYLQALVAQERSSFAQHPSSDTLEDEADGDLDEYLQALVAQERSSVAQHPSSDTLEDEADVDFHRALILSFIESQNLHIASQSTPVRAPTSSSGNLSRYNSFDSELDAAIALSFEEEPVSESLTSATDDRGASPTEPDTEPSDSETVQDDIDPDDMTFESQEEAVGTESTGLSNELLDSFPVLKVIAKSGWFSSTKSDPEGCSICVTEYEIGSKLLTLPCLHLYHKSCIKEWLKDHKTCPICNTDLSVTQA